MEINDKVKIGQSIDNSNPIDAKYVGQIGTIIKIQADEAPDHTIRFENGELESFWPEELTKI